MPGTPSEEEVLRRLQDQARSLWGDRRTEALQASLQTAARHLREIAQNLPGPGTEPGLYPPLQK